MFIITDEPFRPAFLIGPPHKSMTRMWRKGVRGAWGLGSSSAAGLRLAWINSCLPGECARGHFLRSAASMLDSQSTAAVSIQLPITDQEIVVIEKNEGGTINIGGCRRRLANCSVLLSAVRSSNHEIIFLL